MEKEMSNKIFDGKQLSQMILQELKNEIALIRASKSTDSLPKLAYIYMGSHPSILTYLGIKHRTATMLGIKTQGFQFPENTSSEIITNTIKTLNRDASVSGILIQLPLSPNMPTQDIIDTVHTTKDIDGLSSLNIGKLSLKKCEPLYYPCTPAGCIEILLRNQITITGKHVVIIGRSNLVGIPLSAMFQKHDATVTLCHSLTNNIIDFCRQADILAVAIGQPHFINESMVKKGAVILDIGINSVNGRIVGDVHPAAYEAAGFYTPVPGGVGPMTVAMLMKNVVKAWKNSLE